MTTHAAVLLTRGADTLADVDMGRAEESLVEARRSSGYGPGVVRLEGGEIENAARRAANESADVVIVCGRDGSIVVASARVGRSTSLTILPMGTRNHFARDLALPLDGEEAARTLRQSAVRAVDVGEVSGHLFIDYASMGAYPRLAELRTQDEAHSGASRLWRPFGLARGSFLVTHHQLPGQTTAEHGNTAAGRDAVLAAAADCGADAFLSGHRHVERAAAMILQRGSTSRSVPALESGTAVSDTTRGADDSIYVLKTSATVIELEVRRCRDGLFTHTTQVRFARTDSGRQAARPAQRESKVRDRLSRGRVLKPTQLHEGWCVPVVMTRQIRTVSKAAGAAKAAVPSARKLLTVTDEDLRSSVKHLVKSADHLYNQLSSDVRVRALATDDEVRRDVDRIIGSLQGTAQSVGRGARRRLDRRALFIGAGLGFMVACLAAALLYPRTRRRIVRVADETRERATATVHDAREKVSGTVDDAREKVSTTVDDALAKVSTTVDDAREKVSETAGKLRGAD